MLMELTEISTKPPVIIIINPPPPLPLKMNSQGDRGCNGAMTF